MFKNFTDKSYRSHSKGGNPKKIYKGNINININIDKSKRIGHSIQKISNVIVNPNPITNNKARESETSKTNRESQLISGPQNNKKSGGSYSLNVSKNHSGVSQEHSKRKNGYVYFGKKQSVQ